MVARSPEGSWSIIHSAHLSEDLQTPWPPLWWSIASTVRPTVFTRPFTLIDLQSHWISNGAEPRPRAAAPIRYNRRSGTQETVRPSEQHWLCVYFWCNNSLPKALANSLVSIFIGSIVGESAEIIINKLTKIPLETGHGESVAFCVSMRSGLKRKYKPSCFVRAGQNSSLIRLWQRETCIDWMIERALDRLPSEHPWASSALTHCTPLYSLVCDCVCVYVYLYLSLYTIYIYISLPYRMSARVILIYRLGILSSAPLCAVRSWWFWAYNHSHLHTTWLN